MKLPEPFLTRMRQMLGDEYEAFLNSYDQPAARGLRLNLLKAGPDLELPFPTAPVEWCPTGRRYDGELRPGLHPWHDAGVYYIQEPSAMAVAEIAAPRPGERVLDLCAAPGGKTSHLASLAGDGCLLISNEIHPQRARILSRNVERMGIRNAAVLNESPDRLAERFPGFFDCIVVDAPCSGEGMFRKEPVALEEWSEENVALCARRQDEILDAALEMLAPGGRLIYSTCTFAPDEDEGTLSRLLERHPELELSELPDYPGFMPARADWYTPAAPGIEKAARLFPHHLCGEGHFAARLVRKGEEGVHGSASVQPQRKNGKQPDLSTWEEFCRQTLTVPLTGRLELAGDTLSLLPDTLPDLSGLRVVRAGLTLGQLKKGRFEPDHALAIALRPGDVRQTLDLTADDPRTLAYLKGEAISGSPELSGYVLVTVDGFSMGWGKASKGTVKNHYPKGLRRLG